MCNLALTNFIKFVYINRRVVVMIFVDDREPENIVEILRRKGVIVKRKRLEVGDYLVKHGNHEVVVERKTASDFLNSIADGRIFTQCQRMSSKYPISFLFVVGDLDGEMEMRGFRRDAVVAALTSIAIKNEYGQVIPLIFFDNEDFCTALKTLDRRMREGEFRILPRLRRDVIKRNASATQVAMLTAIPGIGEEKAKRILKRFGSVQNVANAGVRELMKVSGIGEKQAKEIYNFFRTKLKF